MRYLISFLQKEKLKREIEDRYLKDGKYPSARDVLEKSLELERGHRMGDPYYREIGIPSHSITNASRWNESFRNLEKDLHTLFEANSLLNARLLSLEERSDLENRYLYARANLLDIRMKRIEKSLKEEEGKETFTENFMDFRNVDLSGTADVNLLERSVSLEKRGGTRRQNMERTEISIEAVTDHVSEEVSGSENGMLGDFRNNLQVRKYLTRENGSFVLKIKGSMEEPVHANAVQMSMESSSSITAALYLSEDDINYELVYETENERHFEWMFEEREIRFFRIILKKNSADGYENGLYDHHFILKNISLYRNIYENKGTFLGRPRVFRDVPNELTLFAEDFQPNETGVVYAIGLERNDGKTRWISCENGEPAELGILSRREEVVNGADEGYGEPEADGLYRIYRIPEKIMERTVSLVPGYQMWYREKLQNVGGYDYIPEMSSYDASKIVQKNMVDTEEYTFSLLSRDLEVLSQYVRVNQDTSVTFSGARVSGETERFRESLYVNGLKIEKDREEFHVPLKKGMNRIVYMLYLESGPSQEQYGAEAVIRMNFREVSDDISAFPEMKYLNPYSMRKETLLENYRYYTISDGYILVKHDPSGYAGSRENEMRYYISYGYLDKNSPYVQFRNGSPYIKARLKTSLVSRNRDFSPKIMNYQLSSE